MTLETWVLVLWLAAVNPSGASTPHGIVRPHAVTYPTQLACERGFTETKSSKTTVVKDRSMCIRFVPVR